MQFMAELSCINRGMNQAAEVLEPTQCVTCVHVQKIIVNKTRVISNHIMRYKKLYLYWIQ